MATITIRPPHKDELYAAVDVSCAAFGERATKEEREVYRQAMEIERSLCAFEADKMVGTSLVVPLQLTVPGPVQTAAGGLTWVAVLPTHRRRGILRRLVAAQFAEMATRGEAVSALLASEGDIYGRFGYGPATSAMSFSVDSTRAAFARPVRSKGRTVLLTDKEAAAELPVLYEHLRRSHVGSVNRSPKWWDEYLYDPKHHRQGGGAMVHVKHETSRGKADGYVTYRIKEEWSGWDSRSTLLVEELLAADPHIYSVLWDYVLNIDLIHKVSCSRGRVDEPLRWLLADPRGLEVTALGDGLWVRLLDVARALAARTYAAEGELVLEVKETFPAARVSRFALRVRHRGEHDVECAATAAPPDLVLEVGTLGAAYLGGVSFATLAAAQLVQEMRPGSIGLADAMLSTGAAPHCSTMF